MFTYTPCFRVQRVQVCNATNITIQSHFVAMVCTISFGTLCYDFRFTMAIILIENEEIMYSLECAGTFNGFRTR